MNYQLPYSAEELIKRAYETLSLREKKKNKFVQPEIIVKDRKTFIINFENFCKSINRETIFVKTYIDKQTQFTSSLITNDTQLKIDTSLKIPHLKNIITIFIKMYILCPECKSSDTTLIRKNRKTFTSCGTCKSEKILNIFS
jgi:translation initiation factor 2 subunit 2